jgi:HEAT repeat protein
MSSSARAADEDPIIQNKKLSEWVEILRGDKGKVQRETALQALGSAASHPNVWKSQARLREAALLAVSVAGAKQPQVFPALLSALRDDPDEAIRRRAAYQLGRLGGIVSEENKTTSKKIRLDDVRSGLILALTKDKAGKVREASARALGQLQNDAVPDAVEPLVAALKDRHEDTQVAAAESLRSLATTITVGEALPKMAEVLKDPKANTMVRVQIALAMGIAGKQKVDVDTRPLLEVLGEQASPDELRVVCGESLGFIAKPSAVEGLAKVLGEKKASVELRRACINSLGAFGPAAKPALPALRENLKDKDTYVRTNSMYVIGRMGKELGADSKEVVKELLKLTGDPIFEVRVTAIDTLGNLGAEVVGDSMQEVMDRLNSLSKEGQVKIREAAEDAKKKLKP